MAFFEWLGNLVTYCWEEPLVAKTVIGSLIGIKGIGYAFHAFKWASGNIPTNEQDRLNTLLVALTRATNGWTTFTSGDSYTGVKCTWRPTTPTSEGLAKPIEIRISWTRLSLFGNPVSPMIEIGGKNMTKNVVPAHRKSVLARAIDIKKTLDLESTATEINSLLAGKVV